MVYFKISFNLSDLFNIMSVVHKILTLFFRRQKLKEIFQVNGISSALPPDPVCTRWNSWFYTVQYHASRVSCFKEFAEFLINEGCDTAVVYELAECVDVQGLESALKFIEEEAQIFIKLTFF